MRVTLFRETSTIGTPCGIKTEHSDRVKTVCSLLFRTTIEAVCGRFRSRQELEIDVYDDFFE